MFETATPIAIFHQQTHILRAQVPGLFDGSVESIHTGRIATRRIRAVLPLIHERQLRHEMDDLPGMFKRMGRSLGRVRDADVRIELLRYLESRIPPAAPSLVSIRQRQERHRLMLMRKLVKHLERLEVERELDDLTRRAAWRRARPWAALGSGWRTQLRNLLGERAHLARDAMAHATGVYFPHRAHQARIAMKKCRYAAEIAVLTGVVTDPAVVRELKKGQDILGELHDRQTLLDQLHEDRLHGDEHDADQIRLITRVAEAEINDLHQRFLGRRPRLLAAIDIAQRTVRHADRAAGAVAVATFVVLGSGLEALRRRRRAPLPQAAPQAASSVSLRIPVALGRGTDA